MIDIFLEELCQPVLLVLKKTGVVYEQQCNGLACHHKKAEGYLFPVGDVFYHRKLEEIMVDFCRMRGSDISIIDITSINILVSEVLSDFNGALNFSKLDELVEGWFPVITDLGEAILLFENCD